MPSGALKIVHVVCWREFHRTGAELRVHNRIVDDDLHSETRMDYYKHDIEIYACEICNLFIISKFTTHRKVTTVHGVYRVNARR